LLLTGIACAVFLVGYVVYDEFFRKKADDMPVHQGKITHGEQHIIEELKAIKDLLERPERVIVFKCECFSPPVPDPVPQRKKTGRVSIPKGQEMAAIKFSGVSGTANSASDIVSNTLVVTVEGFEPYEITVPFVKPWTPMASYEVVVPKGSNFHVYDYDTDAAGNVSSPSVAVDITNASDTTSFSKSGSVTVPPGQQVDDSELPPMVPVTT
jgi:hypothetical protein